MIKPLYINKEDIKNKCMITSYYQYKAILQFLYNVEILAPEVIDDLYPIKEGFEKDYSHMTDDGNSYEFRLIEELANSYMKNIRLPEEITSIRTLAILHEITFFYTFQKIIIDNIELMSKKTADALLNWVKKYNLNNIEYITISLFAMFKTVYRGKYKIPEERQEREYLKEFYLYGIEIPPEIIKKRKNKNYISLSSAIPFFGCLNDKQMPERLKFNSIYPFVFAPQEELILYERGNMLGEKDNILQDLAYYETPSIYDQMKNAIIESMIDEGKRKNADFFIKCEKIKENDIEYKDNNFSEINGNLELFMMYNKTWNENSNPIAWDPREETWEEFQKRIDELYEQYKEAYRRRTEEFFKQNGYVEGKEKRKFDEHIKWLVLYQVKGWELGQVARYIVDETGKSYDESNIYKNVKDVAELVGLTLRDGYR